MNLDKLIDQFIGEWAKGIDPVETKCDEDIMYNRLNENLVIGYNQALQDLKSRKQELVEGIVGIIKNFDIKYGLRGEPITNPLIKLEDVKNFIIKELTRK